MNVVNTFMLKNVVFWGITLRGSCGSYKSHMALTSQKTAFFIVTAVKTSNLTYLHVTGLYFHICKMIQDYWENLYHASTVS
jgi:hypothetical protein